MDENSVDRQKQSEALFMMQRHLCAMGINHVGMRETEAQAMLSWDAEMWVNGLYTGVVEVKCLNYRSDQVESWGHLAVSQDRLSRLRENFWIPSVTGHGGTWGKEVVFLMRCTDNVCFAINIRRLADVWLDCEVAPDDFAKTNHGTESKDEVYRFVPLQHWEKFE